MIGERFGRLTIKEIKKIDKRIYFRCKCDCGKEKIIYKDSVLKGATKSCGCLNSEKSSRRMQTNNPVHMPGIKEKMLATNKRLGTRPTVRGGNGKDMPVPQRVLLSALGKGWYAEHAIPTKMRMLKIGYPTCYKIDVANPVKMIAIEVDGSSHNSLKRKLQDEKKTSFLEGRGWKVLRFKNDEIMKKLDFVIDSIVCY
jgi:hypothetical protein